MSEHDDCLWVESYRPQKVADCILPERLKSLFQQYVNTESIPNLLLSGGPGVGKTTAAIAMCKEIGLNYLLINSSEERGIDTLRTKITNYASTISLTGGKKVIILDEADGITPEAQNALRGAIEKFSNNCSFILTCNFKARLIEAIHSRCAVVDFTLKNSEKPLMAKQFFSRLVGILQKESIPFDKEALTALVMKYFPDYRRSLNELQRFAKTYGKIDSGTLAQISDIRNLNDLISHLKNKNWGEMRKWVVLNSDHDPNRIFRKIYDSLYEFLEPSSIPQAVLIIGKYQYQLAFVADQEINTVACLTEMMIDLDFRGS